MRDKFVFDKTYYEAIKALPLRMRNKALWDLLNYVFEDTPPQSQVGKATISAMEKSIGSYLSSFDSFDKRRSSRYKHWKADVIKRDGYRCQKCGSDTQLCVHHIKSFADYPELRFDIDNGITLCAKCHKEVHKNER